MKRIAPKYLVLVVVLAINTARLTAQVGQGKTAAVTECIMLDLSSNGMQSPAVFDYLSKQQQRQLLDSILYYLSARYSLTGVDVYQEDSIAFTNSSMKGIGRLRKNDREIVQDKQFDYYIKVYSDYSLSAVTVAGAGINHTAQARLSLYIAIFNAQGKRIWFPDAVAKGGISFGSNTNAGNYYNSSKEKAEAYLVLFSQVLGKIFRKEK